MDLFPAVAIIKHSKHAQIEVTVNSQTLSAASEVSFAPALIYSSIFLALEHLSESACELVIFI